MANIFQKVFLSKLECKMIDAIKNNKITSTYYEDASCRYMTASYRISNDKLNIVATHRWHYIQGNDYKLDITHNKEVLPDIPKKYLRSKDYFAKQQEFARKIYTRMREKYVKQKQR